MTSDPREEFTAALRRLSALRTMLDVHPPLTEEAIALILRQKGAIDGPRGIEDLRNRRDKLLDRIGAAESDLHYAEGRAKVALGRDLTRHERGGGFGPSADHRWWLETPPVPCPACAAPAEAPPSGNRVHADDCDCALCIPPEAVTA